MSSRSFPARDDIEGLSAMSLSGRYPVWLCDVWGVVHNGLKPYPEAVDALLKHRATGGIVILITNAPRLVRDVVRQLEAMGVPRDAFDSVCTSGALTRTMLAERGARTAFYIGPERDLALFEGLNIAVGPLDGADVAVCTGLVEDDIESPEQYDGVLADMRAKGLDMICANPDKVVRKGDTLIPCAGALAERYEAIGGRVLMAGKPYAPIYEECLGIASDAAERTITREEVLAIGDGLSTDVEGAARNKLALLFIAGGIHEAELSGHEREVAAAVRKAAPQVDLVGVMPALRW